MYSSDPASNLPDLQKSMLTSFHSREIEFCVAVFLHCCVVQALVWTSRHSKVRQHVVESCCCNSCQILPLFFMSCSSLSNCCNHLWSLNIQIRYQVHPRLNESVSSELKSGHPSLQVHSTSVVFHELHEPVQENSLCTLDEMRS